MEMTYDGALVMPQRFILLNNDEMEYLDGGTISATGILEVIGIVIAAAGATYGAGQICGERVYYAGINTSAKWAKYKWQVRAAVIGGSAGFGISPLGAVTGGIFMMGFENKLYSMMK